MMLLNNSNGVFITLVTTTHDVEIIRLRTGYPTFFRTVFNMLTSVGLGVLTFHDVLRALPEGLLPRELSFTFDIRRRVFGFFRR